MYIRVTTYSGANYLVVIVQFIGVCVCARACVCGCLRVCYMYVRNQS